MITTTHHPTNELAPGGPISLLGREAELRALDAEWQAACLGNPRVVLIAGEAGIGKTALLDAFVRHGSKPGVVRVSGDEMETAMDLGVVDQLLRVAGEASPDLIAACLPAGPGHRPDVVRAGMLVLGMLDRLTDDGPVLLALDDAHWADTASMSTLLFVLRRLMAERVLVVVLTRGGDGHSIPDGIRRLACSERGATMRLAALDAAQIRALAASVGVELSAPAARRLLVHTAGNPLYARALLAELPPSAWLDAEALPAPQRFSATIQQRCGRCASDCRRLLEAVAVLGSGCTFALAAQVADVDPPLEALEEALRANLLVEQQRFGVHTVAFPHPLVRVAVYDGLGPARRSKLHLAAADAVEHEAAEVRHRAAAAVMPDDVLADRLVRFARGEAAAGSWASAAGALRSASWLSAAPAAREQRMLEALGAMVQAGEVTRAQRLADEVGAESFTATALRDALLGDLAFLGSRSGPAEALLQSAWERCDASADPELAATIANRCALYSLLRMQPELSVQWSGRALASGTVDAAKLGQARTLHSSALARLGRFEEAHRALAPALRTAGAVGVALRGFRGWLRLLEDDVPGAIEDLLSAAPAAIECGLLSEAGVELTVLSRAQFVAGQWDDAMIHAERAVALALEQEHALAAFVWDAPIQILAARGEWATADAYVAEAQREVIDCVDRVAWLGVVRALPAAARGDASAVIDALAPLTEIRPRAGIDEPGFWPWPAMYADALISMQRLDEADAFLPHHEALAAGRARSSAICRLARVRGRLHAARGERSDAERAFELALHHGERVAMPYDTALARSAYGQFLRQAGARDAAMAQLEAARECLRAVGARPALEHCERELEACEGTVGKRVEPGNGGLTPHETSVVRLLRAGMRNREIAAALFVSLRTVEFHLTNVYAKLGVRSRSELLIRLHAGDDQARDT